MALTSSLEDFSLAELFRMIEQGRKSGRLTLMTSAASQIAEAKNSFYIWFRHGRVVAAGDRLDAQGLISKITERGWLSQRVIEKLNSYASAETPLGMTLKTQGALQPEQLNLLFSVQMQQIWGFFGINTGQFLLDGKAPLPAAEMTGLSLPALEVALAGLRVLKDWQSLSNALPETGSAVQSIATGKPQIRLSALESQVWEFAQGKVALEAIAKQVNQPVAKVQQAAFRLILAGLVEEVPLFTSSFSTKDLPANLGMIDAPLVAPPKSQPAVVPKKPENSEKPKVSHSFLQNLVGFLRSKA